MNKKDAIEYLEEKGKIRPTKISYPKYNAKEKAIIKEVMKEGKIYGDPVAEVQW